jgi:hypothetical protein
MTNALGSRVVAVCEEFTDTVLYDDIHKSIIVNLHKERFPTLRKELKRYGYMLVHMSKMTETESFTCVFYSFSIK